MALAETVAAPSSAPMMGGMPPDDMQALIAAMQSQQPEPPPLAERLPAESLFRMYEAWESAKSYENQEMWEASKYYHGKQWTESELRVLKRRNQPPTVKNRIRRKVDFLVGVEQRLRRDPKAFPRTPEAEQAAPVATATSARALFKSVVKLTLALGPSPGAHGRRIKISPIALAVTQPSTLVATVAEDVVILRVWPLFTPEIHTMVPSSISGELGAVSAVVIVLAVLLPPTDSVSTSICPPVAPLTMGNR